MSVKFLDGKTSKFLLRVATEVFEDVSCEHTELPKDWK